MAEKIKAVAQGFREPKFFKKESDAISLPFRLSVTVAHEKTYRNLPYLRQSWNRIDMLAIVGFWVSFLLAMLGLERGEHHIGIFRALSVIRTARLLAITSGTTVSYASRFLLAC